MLINNEFYKLLWLNIKFFGLLPLKLNRSEKKRAIFFLIPTVIYYLLHFLKVALKNDKEAHINGLQTLPVCIQMIIECINFVIKSKDIEEIFKRLNELFKKINGDDFFKLGCSQHKIYFILNVITASLTAIAGSVLFGMTGKSPVLIFMPWTSGIGFLAIWLFQTTVFIYTSTLLFLVDQILISLFIFLSFYLKTLRRIFRTRKVFELREILELNLEVKR